MNQPTPIPQNAPPPPMGPNRPAMSGARTPVRELGRGPAQHVDPVGLQLSESMQRLMLDPTAFEDANPLVLELLNQMRIMHIESLALQQVLLERHVVTPQELQHAKLRIAKAADEQLQQAMTQLGRAFVQRPTGAQPGAANG